MRRSQVTAPILARMVDGALRCHLMSVTGSWFVVALVSIACALPAVADLLTPKILTSIVAAPVGQPRVLLTDFSAGLPQQGQWRNGFSIADLNGDGHLDIVHGPPRKGAPWPLVFLGDGAGHWQRWQAARFPDVPYAYGDAAVADFDGDGHADIVLAMHARGIRLLFGDGQGRFRAAREVDARRAGAGAFGSRAVAVADVNGDHRPDVIALGEGMRRPMPGRGAALGSASMGLALFLNRRDGVWQPQILAENRQPFGDAVVVGDANGDGRIDVLIGSHRAGDRGLLYLGEPGGRFRATALEALPDGVSVDAVCMGDVDRDASADLVLGYVRFDGGAWHTAIDLFTGGHTGQWQRRSLADETSPRGVTALACGDLDADGAVDVVALTGDGDLWILLGDGSGALRRTAVEGRTAIGCRGYSVAVADFTKDGRAEIVAGFAGEASAFESTGCPGEGRLEAWQAQIR